MECGVVVGEGGCAEVEEVGWEGEVEESVDGEASFARCP